MYTGFILMYGSLIIKTWRWVLNIIQCMSLEVVAHVHRVHTHVRIPYYQNMEVHIKQHTVHVSSGCGPCTQGSYLGSLIIKTCRCVLNIIQYMSLEVVAHAHRVHTHVRFPYYQNMEVGIKHHTVHVS